LNFSLQYLQQILKTLHRNSVRTNPYFYVKDLVGWELNGPSNFFKKSPTRLLALLFSNLDIRILLTNASTRKKLQNLKMRDRSWGGAGCQSIKRCRQGYPAALFVVESTMQHCCLLASQQFSHHARTPCV
jgi:hypothetical protein